MTVSPAVGGRSRAERDPAVTVAAIGVVIPARNEETTVVACLIAVAAAAAAVDIPVGVVVVADRCTDRTVARARAAAGSSGLDVTIVEGAAGRVGAARRAGVRRLLDRAGFVHLDPRRVWVANTDADSRVPPDWLTVHRQIADAGADLVLGTVRPDPGQVPAPVLREWRRRHVLVDGHPHVHGANLGVRADIYQAAGGFPDLAVHEDAELADAVRGLGGRVVATGAGPVLTSGRRVGRAPAGLSSYLRELCG